MTVYVLQYASCPDYYLEHDLRGVYSSCDLAVAAAKSCMADGKAVPIRLPGEPEPPFRSESDVKYYDITDVVVDAAPW